jgi:hypothetical protein
MSQTSRKLVLGDLCAVGLYPLSLLIFVGDIAVLLLNSALLSRHDHRARIDAGFV